MAGTAWAEQMISSSSAGTPTIACVQAQPRELSNSICASSITATCDGVSRAEHLDRARDQPGAL